MNLRHLRYFLVLCEELNFTRAARQCGISQPSLTNAIRTLERELGAPLFHRSPTGLTGFGRRVRPHLRRAVASIDRARERELSKELARRGAGRRASRRY
jgi:LysR family hydrogen peroxide-inducible transcriptional activator